MSYGKSWEKFPIQENEIWSYKASIVSAHDLTTGLPEYMKSADFIYVDPPWSLRNVNMFNSKAGRKYMNSFDEFDAFLFHSIDLIQADTCYMEVGKESLLNFETKLRSRFPFFQKFEIVYYKKNPCFLLRGSHISEIPYDFTGMDDEETPKKAIELEKPACVADMCMGRGITALAALDNGCCFVGTELNRRKLAVFIDRANRKGYEFKKEI